MTICLRGATWRLFPCVPWRGTPNSAGYGTVYAKDRYDRRDRSTASRTVHTRGAHVDALMRKLGRELQAGSEACHHCDVKLCVQPEHLYEGTHADNVRDARERQRYGRPRSLTPEQAAYVKSMTGQKSRAALAREMHVDRQTIENVIQGRFGYG